MIVVTLACVVLGLFGVRTEYLLRRAAFHRGEARRISDEMDESIKQGREIMVFDSIRVNHHEGLADEFTCAVYLPWTVVDETPSRYD